MAIVRHRRRGLGAFDQAAWDDYQERVRTGQSYIPFAKLEDPNGGIITFDADGAQDYYQPPAAPTGPQDNLPATNDPKGTFYGWTRYEQAAFLAAQGTTGLITDKVRASGVLGPNGVMTYDPAVIAANDAELRAFAQSSPKVQAALTQLQTGPFRGTYGQQQFDANEKLAITNQAQTLLRDWLAFRDNMIRQNPANRSMPRMPPLSHLPPMPEHMSPAVYDEIKRLVAGLPPEAPTPTTATTTTLAPQTTSTAPTGGGSYSPTGFPTPGGSSTGGGVFVPIDVFGDANPDNQGAPMPAGGGGGFPGGGGGGAPSLPSSGQMGGAMALVGVAVLGLMLLKRNR